MRRNPGLCLYVNSSVASAAQSSLPACHLHMYNDSTACVGASYPCMPLPPTCHFPLRAPSPCVPLPPACPFPLRATSPCVPLPDCMKPPGYFTSALF